MFDSVGCCEKTRCCSDQPASPANEAVEFLPTGRFLREASRRCLVCARRVARLILSFVVAPLLRSTGWSLQRAIAPFVADYLVYMNKLEAEGHLWASGPFIEEGVLAGDGLTILSTPTIEEAERVMKGEPLIKRGLRKCELRKWELREGRMTITLNASTSKYSL
jgi:uncharacterized protein YciI